MAPAIRLGGRWEVGAELGRGGEGAVFAVHDTTGALGPAAAKVGPLGSTDGELAHLRRLHHENLATYRDAGRLGLEEGRALGLAAPAGVDGYFWLVTDLADGTLKQDLAMDDAGSTATTTLSRPAGWNLLGAIAAGLAHMHQRGVVHADVKPANVLRFGPLDAPTWRLTDFGIAKVLDDRTSSAALGFSLPWTAPEVIRDGEVRPSSDVYSAAQTVHMALAGRRAVEGKVAPQVTEPMAALLTTMLQPDPAQRPTAVAVLAQVPSGAGGGGRAAGSAGAADPSATVPAGPPAPPDGAPASSAVPAGGGADGGTGQPEAPRRRRLARSAAIVAVVAAAALVAALLLAQSGDDDGGPGTTLAADGGPTSTADPTTGPSASEPTPSDPTTPDPSDPTTPAPDDPVTPVAFASRGSGSSLVLLLDPASGDATSALDLEAFEPSVTPDGRVVAASAEGDDGRRVLVVVTPGEEPRLLTPEPTANVTRPAISPDGTQIAYVTDAGGDLDVNVVDVASGAIRALARGSADEVDPTWSADGSTIAFVRSGSASDSVVVVDAASGAGRAVVEVPGSARSPSLSPDGSEVAYVGEVAGNREALVATVDGGEPRNVSMSAEEETAVVLLADGRLVTAAPSRGLLLVDPSGGTADPLTATPGDTV